MLIAWLLMPSLRGPYDRRIASILVAVASLAANPRAGWDKTDTLSGVEFISTFSDSVSHERKGTAKGESISPGRVYSCACAGMVCAGSRSGEGRGVAAPESGCVVLGAGPLYE